MTEDQETFYLFVVYLIGHRPYTKDVMKQQSRNPVQKGGTQTMRHDLDQ